MYGRCTAHLAQTVRGSGGGGRTLLSVYDNRLIHSNLGQKVCFRQHGEIIRVGFYLVLLVDIGLEGSKASN